MAKGQCVKYQGSLPAVGRRAVGSTGIWGEEREMAVRRAMSTSPQFAFCPESSGEPLRNLGFVSDWLDCALMGDLGWVGVRLQWVGVVNRTPEGSAPRKGRGNKRKSKTTRQGAAGTGRPRDGGGLRERSAAG